MESFTLKSGAVVFRGTSNKFDLNIILPRDMWVYLTDTQYWYRGDGETAVVKLRGMRHPKEYTHQDKSFTFNMEYPEMFGSKTQILVERYETFEQAEDRLQHYPDKFGFYLPCRTWIGIVGVGEAETKSTAPASQEILTELREIKALLVDLLHEQRMPRSAPPTQRGGVHGGSHSARCCYSSKPLRPSEAARPAPPPPSETAIPLKHEKTWG